jgi:hypothetical protein
MRGTLKMLEKTGLLSINPAAGAEPDIADITDNSLPMGIIFRVYLRESILGIIRGATITFFAKRATH